MSQHICKCLSCNTIFPPGLNPAAYLECVEALRKAHQELRVGADCTQQVQHALAAAQEPTT